MRQVAELSPITRSPWPEKVRAIFKVIKKRTTREAVVSDLITITITIILTLVLVVLALNYLAADTIPGDFLYGVKRLSENVHLAVTTNPERQAELEEVFNQRRLAEIETLIQQNRPAVVQFRGALKTKGENLWIVEDHTIFLPDDVTVDPKIREGDVIEIVGLLRTNNVLVADTITRVE
jgi:hypothetical protein